MRNQTFDSQMRTRAQQETLTASQHAQIRLAQAMRRGHVQECKKRPFRPVWAAAAAVLAALVIMLTVQPPVDAWRRDGMQTEQQASFVLANGQPAATPVPVTVPKGTAAALQIGRQLQIKATFSNHTADIWLIDWQTEAENAVSLQTPTDLIWLETEIDYTDEASWIIPKKVSANEENRQVQWSYTPYRVVADVLHWIDEEYLQPGQDGYEEQQSLIEDAFSVGALILLAGDWPDGKSGEMQLVLPDSYQAAYPEVNALEYYTKIGALEKKETVTESLKCETGAGVKMEWTEADQNVRLLKAETTADAAVFLIGFVMPDQEEAKAVKLNNVHFASISNSSLPDSVFSLWVPDKEGMTLWSNDQGQWMRMWQFGFTQGVLNSGDHFSFCFKGADEEEYELTYQVP